jgi:hypothetical protein
MGALACVRTRPGNDEGTFADAQPDPERLKVQEACAASVRHALDLIDVAVADVTQGTSIRL